ncbi:MAG: long-chain fatty acid--CoA ligase [Candidatus Promineifilaceae bacterium]|nr:long-chain fatty acid--CoA ligase [Candidatus Promineifilaceae bacterium]
MSAHYAQKPWQAHYDEGVPLEIDVPDHTLHAFLEQAARNHPNETAIIFKGNRLSYGELNEMADAVAAFLAANGFQKGDRAVLFMSNTPQFVVSYFGVLKAGGIVIATNPLYSERELEHQLMDCGAETVFVMTLFYERLKSVQKKGRTNVKRVVVTNIKEYLPLHLKMLFTLLKEKQEGHAVTLEPGDLWFQDVIAAGRQAPPAEVEVSAEDVALLQYTGGTTGLAKGAVALHRNLVANTIMVKSWLTDLEEANEVILGAIPFFHSYGMVTVMNLAMAVAATVVAIPDPRDQKDVLGSINKYKPTIFPGVPAMYIAINNNPDVAAGKYDLTSIRACISGSAPLLLETKRRFEEISGAKLVEGYGLTEAHVVTHANPVYGENRPGIGLPIPNVEARVVDPENGDNDVPVGEIGELILKSPSIMTGYWEMPTETANVLRDGWLYTGDIARMDEDGYFYIEDRKKDMIIAGGYNIYPREVEEVLAEHPAVVEVAVAGVPHPKRGETVKAWIVKKEGDQTTEEEIIDWSKERLARYKYPRLIEFREELPRTTVGKVLKRELVQEEKDADQESDKVAA